MKCSIKTLLKTVQVPLLIFAFLIGFPPFQSPAQAQSESSGANILFILDASGSMRAKVENKEKIAIAKEVLTNLIKELPEGVKVGLEVYGHRSKGDCNDIQVMVPVGQGDKETLIKQIQSMQPKGETPIAKSLEIAREQLKEAEQETTVVLVSDGKESCKGDPCALIKTLREQGIKVTVHVVGFGVTSEEKQQLTCIAEAGGGKYFTAQNANQLKGALTEVKKEVIEKVEAKAEVKKEEKAKAPQMAILPKGGDSLEAAVPLPLGEYLADRIVPKNTQEYYAVTVKAGQTLILKFRTPATAHPYAGATIYNEDKNSVSSDVIIGDTGALKTIGWTTNSTKEAYTFYLGVGNIYNPNAKGTVYSISLEDNFDANTSSDVGDDFEKALQITPGKYKGFLAGDQGDDYKDFYLITLKANEKVSVKVTPPANVQYKVSIWDQDRVNVAEKTSANPGAIARVSWAAPSESEQEVHLLIEPNRVPKNSASLPYTMEVSVEP